MRSVIIVVNNLEHRASSRRKSSLVFAFFLSPYDTFVSECVRVVCCKKGRQAALAPPPTSPPPAAAGPEASVRCVASRRFPASA